MFWARLRQDARVCFIVFVALGGALGISLSSADQSGLIGLRAEVLSQPGLPVEISDADPSSNIVEQVTTVDYTVTNRGTDPLTHITLLVVLFDPYGNVKGGQLTCEHLTLAAGQQERRLLRLSNLLYVDRTEDYARIVLAVQGAGTDGRYWKLATPFPELLAAMRSGSPLPAALEDVVKTGSCPAGWCADCFNDAQDACGKGIKSYSCEINAKCVCSFSCLMD